MKILVLFCEQVLCLEWVFLWVVQYSPTVQKHVNNQTGYAKLSLGEKERTNVCECMVPFNGLASYL